MKSKKLVSAILAAASIAGGAVGAQAQTVEGLESKVDSYTSRVQQAESNIQDLQTKVNALDTTGIANNKAQIEANKKDIGAISSQLDQGAYNKEDGYVVKKDDTIGGALKNLDKNADKQHWQIDALEKKTGVNIPLSNGATNLSAGVNENTRKIDAEAKAREDADKKLQTNIENEAKARDEADKAEAKARDDADKKLQNNIDNETAARIAGDDMLNSRINQVESDANKGIAKASALAALHPLDYDPDNKFDIAAAGGFYKGENAFALGAFYRPNRNVMLSMGTTLTSGDNAYNVGVTFKIGKSGKHTEAGLTTADLYAMIGAMQDKMDQQQKKIEELEAKQAK